MMTALSYLMFAVTLATALAVMFYTLAPAWSRIVGLLSGNTAVEPMPQLVIRDRRTQTRMRPVSKTPTQRAAA